MSSSVNATSSFVLDGQGIQSSASLQTISTAIEDAQAPLANSVLHACHQSLLRDFNSLSSQERVESGLTLADISTPLSLLELPLRAPTNAIAANIQLYLVQLLRFLASLPSDHWQTAQDTAHESDILGFSSGLLAATVIACARDIPSCITHAVSAFRVGFWLGLRAQQHASKALVGNVTPGASEATWCLVVFGATRGEISLAIDGFVTAFPASPRLYLSAVTHETCISVSGRPDVLHLFRSEFLPPTATTSRYSHIHAFYHSPELANVKAAIVSDVTSREIRFPNHSDLVRSLRSTITGEVISNTARQDAYMLLDEVLDMILLHPVNLDVVTAAISRERSSDVLPKDLVNLGPGNVLWRSVARACSGVSFSLVDLSASSKIERSNALPSAMPATRDNAVHREPIAIVGMAVKFPKSEDASALWEILENGLNTVSEIPQSRFNVSEYNASSHGAGRAIKTKYGNFLDDPSLFDNGFFRVSPREARSMDPQQRLLLHVSYHALENAGYVPGATDSFDPDTFAVYVGVATNDYVNNLRNDVDVYYSTGTLQAFLSGKISYAFGFSGPSLVIDTACSSSMVAIHQACRALNNKDCNAAIAGGVNVMTSPDMYIGLDRAHFLSPTGQCKPWDASADGYSRSEGCGMFVLKRLSDALAENDSILGVIRGVEVNQSARAESITQPHIPTQIDLFRKLLVSTGTDPEKISVVEAHGTGTKAGDPTEIKSIRTVFAHNRSPANQLHLTSIKANIGHAEAASGAASLAKLLLMFRNRLIPPVISLKQLNSRIEDLASDGTCIDTKLTPWLPSSVSGGKRLAALNNFGAAGSNAAMILEEGPPRPRTHDPIARTLVLGLACKSERALEEQRHAYLQHLQSDLSASDMADFTYTAVARRQLYKFRLSATGKTKEELCASLQAARPIDLSNSGGKLIFVFSGQGGQYKGMGARLYQTLPSFRRVIDYCNSKLLAWGFSDILRVINPQEDDGHEDFQTYQCAVFALECALAAVWTSWGLKPDAVVGHSLGEYAALVSASVLSLDHALSLVAGRARLMAEKCASGESGMLAVKMSSESATELLDNYDGLSIACFNSAEDVVIAGKSEQLDKLQAALKSSGRKCARVNVPFAYHTAAMDPLLNDLTDLAGGVKLNPPSVPVVSNVHGSVVQPGDASVFTAQYFARHCGEPVRFDQGIRELRKMSDFQEANIWLELGPHPTTLPMIRGGSAANGTVYLPSLRKNAEDWHILGEALSSLYSTSNMLVWRKVFSDLAPDARLMDIPAYPFAKTQFWVDYREESNTVRPILPSAPPTPRFTVLGTCLSLPTSGSSEPAIFDTPISQLSTLIEGHKVAEFGLCPASVYVEMASAGTELILEHLGRDMSGSIINISDVAFSNPLVYADGVPRIVRLSVSLDGASSGSFTVSSYVSDSTATQPHCSGTVQIVDRASVASKLSLTAPMVDARRRAIIANSPGKNTETFHTRMIYNVIFSRIVAYSPVYHAIQTISIDSNGVDSFAVMQLPEDTISGAFTVHPVFTDTLLHTAGFVINCNAGQNEAFICSQVDKIKVLPALIKPNKQYGVYCNVGFVSDSLAVADAYAFELGQQSVTVVAHMKRMHFRRLRLSSFRAVLSSASSPSGSPRAHSPVRKPAAITAPPPPKSKAPPALQSLDTRSDLRRIKDIMASVLGIQPHQLSEDDDLERLGLDSLTSIEARHSLCSALKVDLPDNLLATCKTVREIDAAVASAASFSRFPPTPLTSRSDLPSTELALHALPESTSLPIGPGDVAEIMSSVLGIPAGDLSLDDDLERLGMDSLMAIEAHHALCTTLTVSLPDNVFAACKTVREVHQAIESSRPPSLPSRAPSPERPATYGTEVNPVKIQAGVSGASLSPLFLVHDGSGMAYCYNRLSPLGREVWGIHNPKFATGERWEGGLVEMATNYAVMIRSKLSVGQSCIVGGWSVGGVIAYEVARHLMASGTVVDGIVLIDSPHPDTTTPLSDAVIASAFAKHPKSHAIDLAKMQMQHATAALVEYDATRSPVRNFSPSKCVLLRSREAFSPAQSDAFLGERSDPAAAVRGWEGILGYRVPLIDIPGNHFEPFEPPNVSEVSQRLIESLELLSS
ncbi:ketoacyl-synt-domain-containing protein [Trametopsis cervina]|nr:ketoacyl-synt-domain-containing protein [Trametopsis cervina]